MIKTLKERIEQYADAYDFSLLARLPVVAIINGRAFHKATSILQKPFSEDFMQTMSAVMVKLMAEIDFSAFAYHFNDEIVIISLPSKSSNGWNNNKIQKTASSISSITTIEFLKFAEKFKIKTLGDPIFLTQLFAVPDLGEVVNTLVYKQQQCYQIAIKNAVFYECIKRGYSSDKILDTISDKTTDERLDILYDVCGIDFDNYQDCFRRGAASYRTGSLDDNKQKLIIDYHLPLFSKEQSFLYNIFEMQKGKKI